MGMVKLWTNTFFRVKNTWLHPVEKNPWDDVRLIAFLNHTSLYEWLFLGAGPWRMLWRSAGKLVAPGADITLNRPIWGFFYRNLGPKLIPISRSRDNTWDHFLSHIEDDSIVIILPEGRMKRANGLDKHGKPMTVRGGIADILQILKTGKMVVIYSGGLHHVQVPGQWLPKLFKKIEMRSEKVSIEDYIQERDEHDDISFKKSVIADLQERMKLHCPPAQGA